MNIIFFTKGDLRTPSSRQRVYLVADRLIELGHTAVTDAPNGLSFYNVGWHKKYRLFVKTLRAILTGDKNTIIYLHRTVNNKFFIMAIIIGLIIKRPVTIFDFDDAIYTHSNFKTRVFMYLSDKVIVANHSLLNWAKKYHNKVYLVPTSIDADVYKPLVSQIKPKTDFVIGWVGMGSAHVENLRMLKPVFKQLSKKYSFSFTIVGAQQNHVLHEDWSNVTEYKVNIIDEIDWSQAGSTVPLIQQFDVGVMPLVDNDFNAGKSAFKIIEYMACGVSAVASPIGENNFVIENKKNGFLANTESDWILSFESLFESSDLRHNMGESGRRLVEENYSFQVNVAKLAEILRSV